MTDILTAYTFHRRRRCNPAQALTKAREDVAANKSRYPRQSFGMSGGAAFAAYGESRMMWFERPADYMRYVGASHEIWKHEGNRYARDMHTGWYVDDDMNETVHGVVYQLPAHNGETRYLYGYADPHNDGAACLSLDIASDKLDAARWADSIAESYAESERDYNRAWQAGRRYEELGEEIASERRNCLELISEAKEACANIAAFPAIKAAIREAIENYLDETKKARRERSELVSNYGHANGFRD